MTILVLVLVMVLAGACVDAGERAGADVTATDTATTTDTTTGTATGDSAVTTTDVTGTTATTTTSDATTSPADTEITGDTSVGPDVVVPPDPDPLPPLEVDRAFGCDPQAIAGLADIAPVAGIEGASVAIRPRAGEPCRFDLVYRPAGAEPVVIPRADDGGGGWLLAVAGRAASGRIVVCASDIVHSADPGASASSPDATARVIDRVDVACATGDGASFSALQPVVTTDATYAAWALGLEQSDETPGRFRLVWIRDFSFQFANLNNRGRPETDGVHTTTFDVGSGGAITLGPTVRISDVIAPGDLLQRDWSPTQDERARHGDYIDFDEGTCAAPDGCELPDSP